MSSGSSAGRDTFLAGAAAGAAVVLAASSFASNRRRRRRPSSTHVDGMVEGSPSHQVSSDDRDESQPRSYPSHHLPHDNAINQSQYYDDDNAAVDTNDTANRIGELPSRQKTKPIPWPWMEYGGYYVAASAKTLMDTLSSFVGPQGDGDDDTNNTNSEHSEGDDEAHPARPTHLCRPRGCA